MIQYLFPHKSGLLGACRIGWGERSFIKTVPAKMSLPFFSVKGEDKSSISELARWLQAPPLMNVLSAGLLPSFLLTNKPWSMNLKPVHQKTNIPYKLVWGKENHTHSFTAIVILKQNKPLLPLPKHVANTHNQLSVKHYDWFVFPD